MNDSIRYTIHETTDLAAHTLWISGWSHMLRKSYHILFPILHFSSYSRKHLAMKVIWVNLTGLFRGKEDGIIVLKIGTYLLSPYFCLILSVLKSIFSSDLGRFIFDMNHLNVTQRRHAQSACMFQRVLLCNYSQVPWDRLRCWIRISMPYQTADCALLFADMLLWIYSYHTGFIQKLLRKN